MAIRHGLPRLSSEQQGCSLALLALLACAPLLAWPDDQTGIRACFGWGLFALALALPLWPRITSFFRAGDD